MGRGRGGGGGGERPFPRCYWLFSPLRSLPLARSLARTLPFSLSLSRAWGSLCFSRGEAFLRRGFISLVMSFINGGEMRGRGIPFFAFLSLPSPPSAPSLPSLPKGRHLVARRLCVLVGLAEGRNFLPNLARVVSEACARSPVSRGRRPVEPGPAERTLPDPDCFSECAVASQWGSGASLLGREGARPQFSRGGKSRFETWRRWGVDPFRGFDLRSDPLRPPATNP